MKAHQFREPGPIDTAPLSLVEIDPPSPKRGEVLLKVAACGICHTDLHIVEGDLTLPRLPLIPGHQIVGVVKEVGSGVAAFQKGDRIGVPWLHSTCGKCEFCTSGKENLCDSARFTGYSVDGGYAEFAVADENAAYHIPALFSDTDAAPLLCAGVIGFRALRLSTVSPGQRVGLYGFGASAHIAIQILRRWGCEVYVFTRSRHHHELAERLGAAWTGHAGDEAPRKTDAAVIFAPSGEIVPLALRALKKGGTIALAGIHMSPIPAMEYSLLYEERSLRSVAHSTRSDVRELLKIAAEIPIQTEVETFPLKDATAALQKLKRSEIRGSGVLYT